MIRHLSRALTGLAVLAASGLSACALLSSPDPVQLYRFGATVDAPVDEPSSAAVPVVLRRIELPEAVRDDRILGVTGAEAAYIKGARWVSDATALYTDSVEATFAAQARRARLIGPREFTRGAQTLDLDVRTFEARYAAPAAAPDVRIVVRARMLNRETRDIVTERTFSVIQPASENRVSAIVAAFDTATRDVNTQLVAWVDANAG